MPEVITIGETMACFVPAKPGLIRYAKSFSVCAAGAESNVAVGLCKLGHTAGWWSILGKDELGDMVLNSIRAEGVDTSRVRFDREHPTAMMLKQTKTNGETAIFYYRSNSAASKMCPEELDTSYIKSAKILHLTGITPVLSISSMEMAKEAMRIAKRERVAVSFDPNIRKKLWKTMDYRDEIREMALGSDIVLMGEEEAEILFGTGDTGRVFDTLFSGGNVRFAGIKYGSRGATVATAKEQISVPPYPCVPVDPTGAGDGFHAAFLAGILEGKPLEVCGAMAGIAGALATESEADTEGYPTRERMDEILCGKTYAFR